jgi:hypothetical protein
VRRNDKKPDPAELGKLALAAQAADDRQGAAFEAELKAEIALLEKVIELARPGFPAIMNEAPGFSTKAVELLQDGVVTAACQDDRLWILEDGAFAQWGVFTFTPHRLALADVCDGWSLAAVVNALATLFRKQITGRTAPAIEAEARTAKLTAIAKLLEE